MIWCIEFDSSINQSHRLKANVYIYVPALRCSKESYKKCAGQISNSCSYIAHNAYIMVLFCGRCVSIASFIHFNGMEWNENSKTILYSVQWIWNFHISFLTAQRKDFQSQIMFSWNICEIELHWRQWRRLRWQWRWWCRWLCVNALIKELAVMVLMQK